MRLPLTPTDYAILPPMANLKLVLMVMAFVLFLVGAGFPFADPAPHRVRLIAAGLASYVAALIFG